MSVNSQNFKQNQDSASLYSTMLVTQSVNPIAPKNQKPAFIGHLQPVTSRMPAKPMVNYEKGGSDFRTPHNTSSFGRQVLGLKHCETSSRTPFPTANRFVSSETVGVGPGALSQQTSMRKQSLSNRRSAESTSFGTSTRDGALKLYAIYTYKK